MTPPVVVTEASVEPEVVERVRARDADVVVMPFRHSAGKAVYSESAIALVKELRALGVRAEYLDGPEERTFEATKSATVVVGSLVLGILSSAAWDGIKALVKLWAGSPKDLSITYVELETPDESVKAWKVDGDAEAALKAIDELRKPK